MKIVPAHVAVGMTMLLSAVPVFIIALLTWNAIDGLITMPRLYTGWASAYVLWWVGFVAALVTARRIVSKTQQPWQQWRVVLPFVVGLIAIGWLEAQSWNDPKHLLPPGFYFLPYALSIVVGMTVRMLSNRRIETDRGAAAHAER